MTQLAVVVDVLWWPFVTLHYVSLNFLVPSTDWHLEGGKVCEQNNEYESADHTLKLCSQVVKREPGYIRDWLLV